MQKLLIFSLIMLPMILYSQRIKKEQVPTPVQNAFQSKFPHAAMVKWSRGTAIYEVDFQQNEDNASAIFDENGTWVSTLLEIEVSQVPAPVKKTYSTIYRVQPEDAQKLEKAAGEKEYVLDSPDGTTTLFFSEKGVLLRKESEE